MNSATWTAVGWRWHLFRVRIFSTGKNRALPAGRAVRSEASMWQPFTEEHQQFRKTVRQFAEKEMLPFADEWEKSCDFPNHVFKKAGELGILGAHYKEEHGGSGGDYCYSVAKAEELPRGGSGGVSMALLVQNDMATAVISVTRTPRKMSEF